LSVEAGKRLIAQAVLHLPQVREALKNHQILIKGGTTASLVSEALCGEPLKISGRIVRSGMGCCPDQCGAPHNILLRKGQAIARDAELWTRQDVEFAPGDVCVIGANLVDRDGRAAMLAGSPLGNALHCFTALASEGVEMIIVAGLEKWAPCSLEDAITAASRKGVDLSMGMAAGLIPIPGKVLDELEACRVLGASDVHLIARGGILGAEGGCTLVMDFSDERRGQDFFSEVQKLSRDENQKPAGAAPSLKDCLTSRNGAAPRRCTVPAGTGLTETNRSSRSGGRRPCSLSMIC